MHQDFDNFYSKNKRLTIWLCPAVPIWIRSSKWLMFHCHLCLPHCTHLEYEYLSPTQKNYPQQRHIKKGPKLQIHKRRVPACAASQVKGNLPQISEKMWTKWYATPTDWFTCTFSDHWIYNCWQLHLFWSYLSTNDRSGSKSTGLFYTGKIFLAIYVRPTQPTTCSIICLWRSTAPSMFVSCIVNLTWICVCWPLLATWDDGMALKLDTSRFLRLQV